MPRRSPHSSLSSSSRSRKENRSANSFFSVLLKEEEIERLEDALDGKGDHDRLVFWVSQSIDNHVKLSTNRPQAARACRDDLMKLARQGRRWIHQIDNCRGIALLLQRAEVAELREKVAHFCDQAETAADAVGRSIKPGPRQRLVPLQTFVQNMIGIAKRAGVHPSTPNRAKGNLTWGTTFLEFVTEALSIATDVIKTSSLAAEDKKAALAKLRYASDKALVKIIERTRGRVRNYKLGRHGLVEWENPSELTEEERPSGLAEGENPAGAAEERR